MNTEPKTIEEYKAANDKLKAEQIKLEAETMKRAKVDGKLISELEEENETAKRIIAQYKRKYGSLEDKPPQQITRVDFGGR